MLHFLKQDIYLRILDIYLDLTNNSTLHLCSEEFCLLQNICILVNDVPLLIFAISRVPFGIPCCILLSSLFVLQNYKRDKSFLFNKLGVGLVVHIPPHSPNATVARHGNSSFISASLFLYNITKHIKKIV